MPPKNKKQKEVVDERFQAIVLTDSFQTRFMPLTSAKPRCLLPLANVPLIEYTLEFLAKAGVNEVYLMCSSHADQIQEYIENSKWTSKNSTFSIKTIMSLESRSVGDAMRDLDNRGLITGDFLLVSGDVVTNIDFSKVMNAHKQRKTIDKDHIVTMVLTPASPLHRTRSRVEPAAFILDKNTNRCLYYQQLPPADGKKTSINIDPELLEDVEDEFVIRNDLIDCHVDICSPHVPQIFQENFDYQYLRNDFVKGVLTSDLLKKTIYAYITDGSEYAARVESWATYNAVSQDILARWCYPLVPDSNLSENNSYTYEFNHIYKEDKIILAQSCKIGNCTSIGNNTIVGDATSIDKSVIGKNCKIGSNVTINNSYIWDNAIIEDNAIITKSIVAFNAKIKKNSIIGDGSVIGFNVVIGENQQVPHNYRIIDVPIKKIDDDFDSASFDSDSNDVSETNITSNEPTHINDTDIVGDDGVGSLYISEKELDDESETESIMSGSINQHSGMIYQMNNLALSDDSIASISNRKSKRHARHSSKGRRLSTTSALSTDFENGMSDEEEDEHFDKEAYATVERAIDNNHDLDTAALELNTLKMSMNVGYHEVRLATLQAMIAKIKQYVSTETLNAKDATNKLFTSWGPLFQRQAFDDQERIDLLQLLQQECTTLPAEYNQIVLFVAVKVLYDLDLVPEENILEWWNSAASNASTDLQLVKKLTENFIVWLQDAEEESEEESDEDSD